MTALCLSRNLGAAALAVVLLTAATAASPTQPMAQTVDGDKIVSPQEVTWGPAPPSIPPGAQAAVLYGDPNKEGMFALRLKLPKGYTIPAHSHPKPEVVTVISGTLRLGMGESADPGAAKPLPAGSFFALSPGMAHFAFTDEETVIQLNSTGPWSLTDVNPQDDPRKATQ